MAVRIKSHWMNDKDINNQAHIKENGQALAFIIWRVAIDKAKNLHGEEYDYSTDSQRITVIAEYLAYMVQISDRLCYKIIPDKSREIFVITLAKKLAVHVQDNLPDFFGEKDYISPFLETLNQRMQDYAQFEFAEGQPSYAFNRYFGEKIQDIMGQSQTNRWIIDQVMDIDSYEIVKKITDALENLLDLE